jgi:hypothetical protein
VLRGEELEDAITYTPSMIRKEVGVLGARKNGDASRALSPKILHALFIVQMAMMIVIFF